jgi:hypothetical protein
VLVVGTVVAMDAGVVVGSAIVVSEKHVRGSDHRHGVKAVQRG